MTSLKIIEEQTYKFLKTETPEVIAIRGVWGTGKTYAWNTYLRKAQGDGKIALDKYSYVSLFGINSLEALKFAIFEKSIGKNLIGKEPSLETFRDNTTSLLGGFGKKAIPFIKDSAAFFRLNDVVSRAVSFLSVNKTIICLDDFERIQLDAQDVLGLISELKEQKACKVVLILNDEGLSDDAKKKYNIYREKVVDKEFNFLPTPEECAQIVFKAEDYVDILKERCCKIGIKNIRIIKKIQQFKNQLKQFLEEKEQETKNNVLSSLVLFTYSLYTKSDEVPDLEFIKSMKSNMNLSEDLNMESYFFTLGERRDQENKNDPEKQKRSLWKNILQDYGYSNFDELDLEIARSAERGYFIDTDIKREIDKYNDNIIIHKKAQPYTEAWGIYHNSFDNNAAEFVQKMYDATKNYIAHISQGYLSSSLCLLRELDAGDKADELIELVIKSRSDADYFNIKDDTFRYKLKDQKMIDRFSKVFSERSIKKTLLEVLNKITSGNGWGDKDEEVLASYSVDDYFALFKSEKSERLTAYIDKCLLFGSYINSTERQKLIATNAEEALKKIGSENKLNKLRIKKFGIKD